MSEQRLAVVTMGCRVNQVESAWLQGEGTRLGWRVVESPGEADVVVVNTCSVTGESDRQARQLIRRIHRDNPHARVVVTGCSAQREPGRMAGLPGVVEVVDNPGKEGIPRWLAALDSGEGAPDPSPDGPPALTGMDDRARAWVQVQTGCDERCTYCIIPSLRGPGRSLDPAGVMAQARAWLGQGRRELVLTGINLGAYGRDLLPVVTLSGLVRELLALSGLARLRLSSIDPLDVDAALLDLLRHEPRLCGHFHLSIQSGDDLVLKRMGRRYRADEVLECVARLRTARPGLVLGADFIVGFPTESDAAFQNTLILLNRADIALPHVFRYSPRPGTPAAAIPARFQVAAETARERSRLLREAGRELLHREATARQGQCVRVLVEEGLPDNHFTGKSEEFLPVSFHSPLLLEPGALIDVVITGFKQDQFQLSGRAVGGEINP